MTVRVRPEQRLPAPSTAGRAAPRLLVYPHRSVRFLPISRARLILVVLLSGLITGFCVWKALPLMTLHAKVSGALAGWGGVPIKAWEPMPVFPGLEPALAPVTGIPAFEQVPEGARLLLILSVVALLIVSRHYVLTRNLAGFLIVLLIASAVVNVFFPNFRLDSRVYGQIWLRSEMLVWLLLPWVASLLFLLGQPRIAEGIWWTLAAQVYGFFFSAFRMTFLLGVLHYTGLLFFPPLWFLVGTLSDLLFLLLFYSICLYRVSGKAWGVRSQWRLSS